MIEALKHRPPIEIVGRTEFLDCCHRNTPEVLDLAFNVLVGSSAAEWKGAAKRLPLIEPATLTMSTVHSAKGYDAAIVIVVGVDQFDTTVEGRALFYVAATRARHLLILTSSGAEPRRGDERSLLGEVYAVARSLGYATGNGDE